MKTVCGVGAALLLIVTFLLYSNGSRATATTPLGETEKAKVHKKIPRDLCGRLSEIECLPFQVKEKGHDPVYDAFMEEGERVIPCLVEAIADRRKMDDPREAPKFHDFRVGDLAFFMFCRIHDVSLEDFLPLPYRKEADDIGVFAYFHYVGKKGNRAKLQMDCRKWLEEKNREKALPKS